MTNRPLPTKTVLLIVAACALVAPAVASAQYRVGSDGRANDANNRLGSGGYNTGTGSPAFVVTPNQVVTGNVTGGREFRGPTGSVDQRAFRGVTSDDTSDRFIRGSSGVPVNGVSQNNAQNATAFYGNSRATAPPAGFQQQGTSGAFVPAPAPSRSDNDLRLGSVVDTPQSILPPPGDLMMPGPVDAGAGDTLISASPLYGIRQWRAGDADDQQFIDRMSQDQRPKSPDQLMLDQQTIERYRTELRTDPNGTKRPGENGDAANPLQSGADLSKPRETPSDPSLATGALATGTLTNERLTGRAGTDQSLRNQLLVPPGEQSALYARLLQQFEQQGAAQTDQEAQRRFEMQKALQAKIAADKKGAPGKGNEGNDNAAPKIGGPGADGATGATGGPGAEGGTVTGPDDATPTHPLAGLPVAPEGPKPAAGPVKVSTLAEGIEAKGLSGLLTGAEENMRAGQFGNAIDKYDAAAKVVPNNPLVTLGRAHAELGASYYGRAESDLRRAFTEGPALLAGQYDLVTMLGEERLQFLIKDLKEIASAEPQQATPTFLLGYIARNMGNDKRAADYLTESEKRLGGPDPLIGTLRTAWRLPTADAGTNP